MGRLFLSGSGGGLQTIASTLEGNAFWIALAIGRPPRRSTAPSAWATG